MAFKLKILRDNLLVIISGVLVTLFFIYIGNNNFFISSYKDIIECGGWYIKEYAVADGGTLHNNSLWGLFKFVVYFFYSGGEHLRIINFMSFYLEIWPLLLISIFLILTPFVNLFKHDENKFSSKFFLICLLIPLLSPIAPDYRLFFLNVCLIILFTNKVSGNFSLNFIASILVFILFPKEFLWFALNGAWFTPNGVLNCTAMLILLGYIVMKSFKLDNPPH